MAQKRTYTQMKSSEVLPNANKDPQPASKRRKISSVPLVKSTTLQSNINIPNQKQKHRAVNTSNTGNLRTNRVTTKAQCMDINIKNTTEYEQLKQRILNQPPSPVTSPECPPSLTHSVSTNTTVQSPLNHLPSPAMSSILQIPFENPTNPPTNQNRKRSTANNTKRRLRFDLNDGPRIKTTPNIPIRNTPQHQINGTNAPKTVPAMAAQSPVPHATKSINVARIPSPTPLERRKLFRTHVLNHLEEDRARIQWLCMIFVVLFGGWSVVNVLYLYHYDAMHVLVLTLIILMVVKDISECTGEGGVYIMILFTFLIQVSIEFMVAITWKPKYIEFDVTLINNELAFVLLMIMVYSCMYDRAYLIQTVTERIFNRGIETRLMSYLMYFWFNAYMVTELISFLYDIKPNAHSDFAYLLTSYVNLSVVSAYIAMVSGLWFKLQDTKFIDVEQFKVNEMCGFIAMIVTHYGLFFGAMDDGNRVEASEKYVAQPYVLLVFIAVFAFNKLFYF